MAISGLAIAASERMPSNQNIKIRAMAGILSEGAANAIHRHHKRRIRAASDNRVWPAEGLDLPLHLPRSLRRLWLPSPFLCWRRVIGIQTSGKRRQATATVVCVLRGKGVLRGHEPPTAITIAMPGMSGLWLLTQSAAPAGAGSSIPRRIGRVNLNRMLSRLGKQDAEHELSGRRFNDGGPARFGAHR